MMKRSRGTRGPRLLIVAGIVSLVAAGLLWSAAIVKDGSGISWGTALVFTGNGVLFTALGLRARRDGGGEKGPPYS